MKKQLIIFFVLLQCIAGLQLKAQGVTFRVNAPPSVVAGAQFNIEYTIRDLSLSLNENTSSNFRVAPEFNNVFDVLSGPTKSITSSMILINGKNVSVNSDIYTFTVAAKPAGTLTIGPASVQIGTREYKSNSFTVNVLPSDQAQNRTQQQSGGTAYTAATINEEDIFLRMIVSNSNVYEQEGFLVTYKLYFLPDLVSVNPKYPDFEEFIVQDIELPAEQQMIFENYNGRNYKTYIIRQAVLYPLRSGRITIGSGKVEATARVQAQSQRARSVFDDFFGTYQQLSVAREASPVTINVRPLPAGKPAFYSNAVGNYSLSSAINRTELKADESITIKLTIRGNGNIRIMKNPEIKFPDGFDVYEPQTDNNISVTTVGASGVRTIEYTAIPRTSGYFEIPAIRFSYFDPAIEEYQTLNAGPYQVRVGKNAAAGQLEEKKSPQLKEDKRFRELEMDDFYIVIVAVICGLVLIPVVILVFTLYERKKKKNTFNANTSDATKGLDESFDDFIQHFCKDTEFQLSRIKFPIGDLYQHNWKHISKNHVTPFENKSEGITGEWLTRTNTTSRFVAGKEKGKVLIYTLVFEKERGKWYLTDYIETGNSNRNTSSSEHSQYMPSASNRLANRMRGYVPKQTKPSSTIFKG